ncbi:MAG: LPP20 family lipoprotein, partial [Bdellovibrionota bacterium]
MKIRIVGFCFAALLAGAVFAQRIQMARAQAPNFELVEKLGTGVVSWSGGYVEAEGSGAPNGNAPSAVVARLGAERAAKADALRNLLEAVKGVRVASETTVENFVTTSDTIRTKVEGVVRGAIEIEKNFDGQVATVKIRAPLWGELAAALYDAPGLWAPPQQVPGPVPINPGGGGNAPPPGGMPPPGGIRGSLFKNPFRFFAKLFFPAQAYAVEQGAEPTPTPSETTKEELKKTGIILDLTDVPAKPELFPRIIDSGTGRPIVDARSAGTQVAASGIIGYAPSVEAARQNQRSGANPLIMKAINMAAGTDAGLKVDFTSGMNLDTAERMLTNPG